MYIKLNCVWLGRLREEEEGGVGTLLSLAHGIMACYTIGQLATDTGMHNCTMAWTRKSFIKLNFFFFPTYKILSTPNKFKMQ